MGLQRPRCAPRTLPQVAGTSSGAEPCAYKPASGYTIDGNGNVVALVNGDTGALASAYEYDPFGQGLRADVQDAVVADQPFRFSTKWWDKETGMAYYGHRYYAVAIGRFINRDPSEEAGGDQPVRLLL